MYSGYLDIRPWANHKEISHLTFPELMQLYYMAIKATPGPWRFNLRDVKLAYEPDDKERVQGDCGNDSVCSLYVPGNLVYTCELEGANNGEFIAHSHPGVVAYLIREIKRLRDLVAEMSRKG